MARPNTNQYAKSFVKCVKKAVTDTLKANPGMLVSDYVIQSLVHNLAHENMPGQMATAHQAPYMTMGQDEMIEVNHISDWWDVRNQYLQKFLDVETVGPGEGSVSVNPAMCSPIKGRDHGKCSNYEVFQRGDGMSIREGKERVVRYGWILNRCPDNVMWLR